MYALVEKPIENKRRMVASSVSATRRKNSIIQRLVFDENLGRLTVPNAWINTVIDDRNGETLQSVNNYQGNPYDETAAKTKLELLGNLSGWIGKPVYEINSVDPVDHQNVNRVLSSEYSKEQCKGYRRDNKGKMTEIKK